MLSICKLPFRNGSYRNGVCRALWAASSTANTAVVLKKSRQTVCLPGSISIHYIQATIPPQTALKCTVACVGFSFFGFEPPKLFFSHALQQREQTEYWNWYLIGWQVFLDKDILPKFEDFSNIGQYASQKLYLTETYQ